MKLVKITHPRAGESQVPESAVPHWTRAGWRVVGEDSPAAEVAAQEDKSPRGRRKSEGEG